MRHMATTKRIGFYVELFPHSVRSIRRMAKANNIPQWAVVANAVSFAEEHMPKGKRGK